MDILKYLDMDRFFENIVKFDKVNVDVVIFVDNLLVIVRISNIVVVSLIK